MWYQVLDGVSLNNVKFINVINFIKFSSKERTKLRLIVARDIVI